MTYNSSNISVGSSDSSKLQHLVSHQDIYLKLDNMADFILLACSTAIIFGGVIPYIPQYMKIHRTLNSEGFSTYVCLTLLIANIMRIMFWYGHPFELPFLLQSFVMIAAMLTMVEICVRVKDKDPICGTPITYRNFWKWNDFASYIKFLLLFTITLSIITHFLINCKTYIEVLGFLALSIESMLGAPQLLKNYAKRSTRGMSVSMVVLWLAGDMFKTIYSVVRDAPMQFYMCSSVQVVIDLLILGQVLCYKKAYSLAQLSE